MLNRALGQRIARAYGGLMPTYCAPMARPRRAVDRARVPWPAVAGIAALAVAGALAAHPHPTAERGGDVVAVAAFAIATTIVSARSRPVAWLVAWGIVLVLGGPDAAPWALAGTGAAAATVRWTPRRVELLGAALGAGLVQVLLRMPTDRLAVNLLASTLAIGALVLGREGPTPRTRRVAQVAAVVTGIVLAAFVVSLLLARRDLEAAVDRTHAGLAAARRGESGDAAAELHAAADAFRSANGHLASWWAAPARYLPVVGQNARSLEILSDVGGDLAATAAAAALDSDSDSLRIRDGRLDLAQVAALAEPLADVRVALREAATTVPTARSGWLVEPVAGRLEELEETVSRAFDEAATAEAAVEVAPSLLGGREPRTYFVAFGNPAETRELGGFMGAFALLRADDGKVTLGGTARVRDINQLMSGRQLTDRSVFPDHYLAQLPQVFWQNVTGASDFPTVAEAVTQLWPSRALGPLDGVIYMDPIVLSDLLTVTGPIRLDGLDRPLTAATAAEFLLRGQYVEFPEDDRHDFLTDAAETVFDELTSHEIEGPSALIDALAPSARARRILIHSTRPDEEAVFQRLELDGSLGLEGASDLLSVRSSNRGLNKVDAMLRRQVSYDVRLDPDRGTVRSTVEVVLSNDAPASGLPLEAIGNRLGNPPGTSSATLAVYTPLDLVDVTTRGEPMSHAVSNAHGLWRYAVLLDIPPGGEVRLQFDLEGRFDPSDGYSVRVVPQALAEPDQVDVEISAVAGWGVEGRTSMHRSQADTEELTVRVARTG